jgi:hypothetical protein
MKEVAMLQALSRSSTVYDEAVSKSSPGLQAQVLIFFGVSLCAWGWPLSLGVKTGAPVTGAFDCAAEPGRALVYSAPQVPFDFEGCRAKRPKVTVGPTVELRLPHGWAIEVDALRKPLSYQWRQVFINTPSSGVRTMGGHATMTRWEFPLLAKYRRPIHGVEWFLAGGGAYSRIWNVQQEVTGVSRGLFDPAPGIGVVTGGSPAELVSRKSKGVVAGAGVELRWSLLRFTPEVRYTRWVGRSFDSTWERGYLRSGLHQVDILLGVSFALPHSR